MGNDFWGNALQIASQVKEPIPVAAIGLVFMVIMFLSVRRAKKSIAISLLSILAIGVILACLAPLAAQVFLQSRGLYRVRVIAMDPDRLPAADSKVTSSIGGEPKKTDAGWEFDIPPQSRPADGKVTFYASVKGAFLSGNSTLVLEKDYFPTVQIQLGRDTSAKLWGTVVDDSRRSVAGAQVSIAGYSDIAVTDVMGNFTLPAHAADGQIVVVRAQKGKLATTLSVPAGAPTELILKRQ